MLHSLGEFDRAEGKVKEKRAFWVLSKQPKEITGFGKRRVPAHFKIVQEARKYCGELNLRKGAYHPGYFVEERIGDRPVNVGTKKAADSGEESE